MTPTERRPGEGRRGDVDDQPAGEVSTEGIPRQLRRRRAASWRLPPLVSGLRDPMDPVDREPLTDAEFDSWRAAWCHLDRAGLVAVIPERVLAAAGRRSS